MAARTGATLKTLAFAGLAAILPTLLIILIVQQGFDLVHAIGGSYVYATLFHDKGAAERVLSDLIALALLVTLVLGAGFLVGNVFGRQILDLLERSLLRIPLIKAIYPALRQLTDFLVSGKRPAEFQRVVAIPYPHPGVWSIGFVTGEGLPDAAKATGRKLLCVFIPSSPAPITGWICLVPQEDAIPLKMSVEEAIRFCVSVGVSRPGGPMSAVPAPIASA